MPGRAPIRRRGKSFEVRISKRERDALRMLPGQLRELLAVEDPSSDAAVARLFPPAYPDDLLRNLDYERGAGDDLLAGRLRALDEMERTLEARRLSEEELLAWLASVNDFRLVLGTRLEVTEETTEANFGPDDARADAYGLYSYLTWLEASIIDALAID